MNISRAALNHPYAVAAAVLLVAAMGFIGFLRTPSELFPDTFNVSIGEVMAVLAEQNISAPA